MIDRVSGKLIFTPSQCSSIGRTVWKGAADIMTDTYLAYLTTFSVILISTALLRAGKAVIMMFEAVSYAISPPYFVRA